MKALIFLDMWHLPVVEIEKYLNNKFFWRFNNGKRPSNINFFARFLKQPFRPELVNQMFEIQREHLLLPYYVFPHYEDDKYAVRVEYTGHDGYPQPVMIDLPITLNDFILDCKRARIELKWRTKMIAMNFLETTLKLINDPDTPKDGYMIEIIKRDAEHFSQPFQEGLIPVLFEGWEYTKKCQYQNNYDVIEILFHDKKHWLQFYDITNGYDDDVAEFPLPKTFDEFITLCSLANVELIWRQQ